MVAASAPAFAFTFTTIDVPAAAATGAYGINAQGRVVGYFIDASGAHGL